MSFYRVKNPKFRMTVVFCGFLTIVISNTVHATGPDRKFYPKTAWASGSLFLQDYFSQRNDIDLSIEWIKAKGTMPETNSWKITNSPDRYVEPGGQMSQVDLGGENGEKAEQSKSLEVKGLKPVKENTNIEQAVNGSKNPNISTTVKMKETGVQRLDEFEDQLQSERLLKDEVKTNIKSQFNKFGELYKAKKYRAAYAGFLTLATKNDNAKAQFNVSVMLKLGQGTVQDYSEAYKWCALASLNHLDKAKRYLETLTDLLPEKRLIELHKEIIEILEKKIYEGSPKYISQLSAWLLKEPFNNKNNKNSALVWELVGSALELEQSKELRDELADLDPEEMQQIQKQAKEIFLDPKFSKVLRGN